MLTNTYNSNSQKPITKEEWFALVEEWENSKESQRLFCERKGIQLTTFTYYRGKLISERQEKKTPINLFPSFLKMMKLK